MNVGIIGSGGREHAISHSLKNSKKVNTIYCIPGNAGTKEIAINIDIDLKDFDQIFVGDTITTDKNSTIVISFTDNSLLTLKNNSELMKKITRIDFESVNSPSKGNFHIFLKTIK